MANDLDIRLLRMFSTLARVGSYTRTASALHLTQSAISHGMRRLEDQLDCKLIYKKGKTTHLTPDGRHFLGQILRVLDGLDRAAESMSSRAESRGKLSIVLSTSIAHAILASVLREYRESYPEVSIVVRLENAPRAIEEIEQGRADLAIIVSGRLPEGLRAHPLMSDRLQLFFSPIHAWAKKQRVTAAEMKCEHMLLYQRDSVTFRQTEDFLLRSGIRLSSYVEIPSFEIMKQLTRLGLGVALMAPWVATKELEEGSLATLPTPRFKIERKWSVVHQGHRELRPHEQTFIGLCRMACRSMVGTEPQTS
ncbi:MAG: LysR family transcriptional regulator [Terrimicrobiaceae bacterium]|nr:LysR family transcriptional regulator [Terrimicrobiaceae bacterium]